VHGKDFLHPSLGLTWELNTVLYPLPSWLCLPFLQQGGDGV